ncbi:hypothetical protein, partial [Aeromonas sp. FDAARGOS 1402]|uniref:hypothetical protein n=1 Tax=Aeromonas sp. FDAARGOS 1402 TaxID=2778051 RepID=UPI001C241AF7
SFDLLELAAASPLKLGNVYLVVRRWLANGHLRVSTRNHLVAVYRSGAVVISCGCSANTQSGQETAAPSTARAAERRKTVQQKMWNTMKISRFFTLNDLAITSGVDDSGASTFTTFLVRAGLSGWWTR